MPRPKERPVTGETPVVVNVHKTGDLKPTRQVPLSLILTVGALVFTAASFAATFIFVTKAELAAVDKGHTATQSSIKETMVELKGDVRVIRNQMTNGSNAITEQKSRTDRIEKKQDVIDENIRRLLRRERIPAAGKITIEDPP